MVVSFYHLSVFYALDFYRFKTAIAGTRPLSQIIQICKGRIRFKNVLANNFTSFTYRSDFTVFEKNTSLTHLFDSCQIMTDKNYRPPRSGNFSHLTERFLLELCIPNS